MNVRSTHLNQEKHLVGGCFCFFNWEAHAFVFVQFVVDLSSKSAISVLSLLCEYEDLFSPVALRFSCAYLWTWPDPSIVWNESRLVAFTATHSSAPDSANNCASVISSDILHSTQILQLTTERKQASLALAASIKSFICAIGLNRTLCWTRWTKYRRLAYVVLEQLQRFISAKMLNSPARKVSQRDRNQIKWEQCLRSWSPRNQSGQAHSRYLQISRVVYRVRQQVSESPRHP